MILRRYAQSKTKRQDHEFYHAKIELTNEFGKIASDDFALLELEHVFLILEVDHGFEYLHCKVLILRLEVPHQIP